MWSRVPWHHYTRNRHFFAMITLYGCRTKPLPVNTTHDTHKWKNYRVRVGNCMETRSICFEMIWAGKYILMSQPASSVIWSISTCRGGRWIFGNVLLMQNNAACRQVYYLFIIILLYYYIYLLGFLYFCMGYLKFSIIISASA